MRRGNGGPPGLSIRPETPDDHAAISEVVEAAFESAIEARLVQSIRASIHFIPELSLVAELNRRVVGHVMISEVFLHDGEARRTIPSLSPLAVSPDLQKRGIGSALVREVTALADERGGTLVALEGSPRYYGGLGFEYSVPYGISFNLPSWAPAEAAQIMRLANYDSSIKGHVVYPPAFDEATEHA